MKTKAVKDQATIGLVPKLRFPEFRAAPAWRLEPLSQLATRTKQKNRDEQITRVLTNSAEFGVMDQRDFFEKDIATQGNLDSYFVVELGSYVYNPRISATAPVGPISKNKIGTGVMSPLYTVFSFKNDSNDFYEHYFKTTGWHTYMRQASSTGARHDRMAISGEDFMAMPLPVSTPEEQQKIADCLDSLDELIAAQGRKVEALKTHKKGLMQQLFPREGETQPRLRFREFQDSGGWKTKSLGSFCKVGDIDHKMPSSTADGIPYVMTGDFFGVNSIDYKNAKKISIEDYERLSKKIKPELGDTIIARYASVGTVRYIETKLEFLVSYSCAIIKCDKSEDPRYLYCALQSDTVQSQIRSEINASSQKNIGIDSIKKLRVFLPTLPEQQKISACLANCDALITAAVQELDVIKTHKQGLMQQLFPSVEALEA